MKEFLNDIRMVVGGELIRLALRVFPQRERQDFALTINPMLKEWSQRSEAQLSARGIKIGGKS